jgi:hypothetical protein
MRPIRLIHLRFSERERNLPAKSDRRLDGGLAQIAVVCVCVSLDYCLIPSPLCLWCPLKLVDERVHWNHDYYKYLNGVISPITPLYKMQLMYDKTPRYCSRIHSSPSCTLYNKRCDLNKRIFSLFKIASFGKQSIRATHSPVGTGMFANSPRHSRLEIYFAQRWKNNNNNKDVSIKTARDGQHIIKNYIPIFL